MAKKMGNIVTGVYVVSSRDLATGELMYATGPNGFYRGPLDARNVIAASAAISAFDSRMRLDARYEVKLHTVILGASPSFKDLRSIRREKLIADKALSPDEIALLIE